VWLYDGEGAPVPVTPEGWYVNSADFAPNAQRLLVSARPVEESEAPYQIYLVDWYRGRTVQITQGESSYLEVDQAP
jgi:hypothetical protein